MGNPVAERNEPKHPGGGYSTPGVAGLREQFPNPESAKAYKEWADHPVTKLVRKALVDMALNGVPGKADNDSLAVQYGISLGLGVAAQMLEDAALVVPGMYRPVAVVTDPANLKPFSIGPHEALDQLKV